MCIDVIMHEWCWRNVSCVQASQSAALSPLVLHWKWSQLQINVHWIDLSAFVHFKIGFRLSGSFPFFFQLCSDSLFGFYPLHSKDSKPCWLGHVQYCTKYLRWELPLVQLEKKNVWFITYPTANLLLGKINLLVQSLDLMWKILHCANLILTCDVKEWISHV